MHHLSGRRVLVAGVIVAFVACRQSDAEKAAANKAAGEKAMAVIAHLGGDLTIDERSPGKPVISVTLRNAAVTDAEASTSAA